MRVLLKKRKLKGVLLMNEKKKGYIELPFNIARKKFSGENLPTKLKITQSFSFFNSEKGDLIDDT